MKNERKTENQNHCSKKGKKRTLNSHLALYLAIRLSKYYTTWRIPQKDSKVRQVANLKVTLRDREFARINLDILIYD